jgi:hypothetical protein
MKFVAATVAILSLVAKAQNDTDVIQGRKFSAIMDMIMVSGINTVHDEATLSKMIRNYGCHCFPDYTRKTSGTGQAVNDVDGTCRDLNRCKKCIELDGLSQDCENGDPDQGKYDYSVAGGAVDCNPRGRNNACKVAQCECDKAFAENLSAVWTDASFDLQYWATIKNINAMNNAGTPVFDYATTCVKLQGGSPADACCGASYPNKVPYVSTNRECCADGSLKLFGSC